MADRIVENADQIVDEMKRKARRRLVGAIVLALAAAILLPMLLEKEPRPLGDDVSVKIPPVDEGKFINRLTGKSGGAKALPKADDKADSKAAPAKTEPRNGAAASPPIAAPAASAAPESGPANKTVTEAEQRVLTSSPKAPAKSEGDASPAVESKGDPQPTIADTPAPAADEKPAATRVATAQPASSAGAPAKSEGFVVQLAAFI